MRQSFHNKFFVLVYFLLVQLTFAGKSSAQMVSDTLYAHELNSSFVSKVAFNIKGNRVVMLGEPTHGEGNILKIKTQIIKCLVEDYGFSVIAFESGIYDLWKANKNIQEGNDCIQSYKDGIFNVWSCSEQMKEMFELLNTWQGKVSVVGFDSQFSGEYAPESILEDVRDIARRNKIDIRGDDLEFWAESCREMAESFNLPKSFDLQKFKHVSSDLLTTFLKAEQNRDVKIWVQIIKSVSSLASDYWNNSPSSIPKENWKAENSNVRDSQMAKNLAFLMDLYAGRKMVCWGASAHFSKGFDAAESDELQRYFPMGKILKDSLGISDVTSIAFTGFRGTYGIGLPVKELEPAKSETLEANVSNTNYNFAFIPLADNGHNFVSQAIEFKEVKGKWSESFDSFFYSREITPNDVDCNDASRTTADSERTQPYLSNNAQQKKAHDLDGDLEYFVSTTSKENFAGRVIDAKTGEAVPFATVMYKGTHLGTIVNQDGNFEIYRSPSRDTLQVSSIGYEVMEISIKSLKRNTIRMNPKATLLSEVMVKGARLSARGILEMVLKRFPQNYYQGKYTYIEKITERVRSRTTTQLLLKENVLEKTDKNGYVFSSPYPIRNTVETKLLSGQVFSIDSATLDTVSYSKSDQRIVAAIGYLDLLNYRKNTFLNPDKWRSFQFELLETKSDSEGRERFIIEFKCKRPNHYNTLQLAPIEYWGTFEISSDDFAILKFETFTRQDKTKIWKADELPTFHTESEWFSHTKVVYEKEQGFYFLKSGLYVSNWDVDNGYIKIENSHFSLKE